MKVGDLVYIPYFKAYEIIVSKYELNYYDGFPEWNVVQCCGYRSNEYEHDLELVSCK